MPTVKMAYKYRAYPTNSQKKYINECIRSCWWFYRYVLHHYEDDYTNARKNFQQSVLCWYNLNAAYHPYWLRIAGKPKIPKEFYPLGAPLRHQGKGELSTYKLLQKVRNERPHLQQVPAIVLQEVLERVAHAFNKFWKEGAGYPRYPKERQYRSITWIGIDNIELYDADGLVKLIKFPGLLKIVYHRHIKGKIKRANISKDILGQYYISLMCEFDEPSIISATRPVLGIDMNIKVIDETSRSFIALSNGEKVDIPRWFTEYEVKLAKIQKKIAGYDIGSPDWRRYDRRLKHLFENVQNKRNEWIHALTHRLASDFEYVVIEDLPLTGFHKRRKDWQAVDNMQLAADRGLRKAWTETPFGKFKRQLAYKLGDRLIAVDPKNTSKRCNVCGTINQNLTLSDRQWKCSSCNISLDRDINAAINIRNAGLEFLKHSIKTQQEKME